VTKKESKQIKDAIREPRSASRVPGKDELLSTGSTLLNLALTGTTTGGFAKGKYFWFVGDSSSGKTFFCLTCMAEAAINPNFSEYDLIFDNAEDGALMKLEQYFGAAMAARLQPPAWSKEGEPLNSRYLEDFYFHLDDRLIQVEQGKAKPFIYVLDSLDALDTKYGRRKFNEQKDADRKGTKAKGDYGDGKAKINSQWIRGIRARVQDTGSVLIIISQTRDDMEGQMFSRGKASGGRALKFYATCQIWSSVGAAIKKTVHGDARKIGQIIKLNTVKNRMSGKDWEVVVPFYFSYGIDDIGSCIDFMVKCSAWPESNGSIKVDELQFKGRRATLIKQIEDNGWEEDVRLAVKAVWKDIEAKCDLKRKPRY